MEPKEIIKKYIETHPSPARGTIIDIVKYPDRMAIRFYRDDFENIPTSKQQDMVSWLETTMRDLNFHNKFVTTIEMEERVPNAM